jgi:hypothetical protein
MSSDHSMSFQDVLAIARGRLQDRFLLRAPPSRHAFGLAWVGVCLVACIPRGAPPTGRQIVADRTSALAGIVRPNGDGITRVLVARPGKTLRTVDLYVVSVDATGSPPAERLLASEIQATGAGVCGGMICFGSDARGRIFVYTGFDPITGDGSIARIDPVTGDRLDFDPDAYTIFSPSGERVVVLHYDSMRSVTDATLYEADDSMVPLGATGGTQFVGEDLYYTTAQNELERLVPGGSPELLATGVASFGPATTQGDLVLLLIRSTADPQMQSYSFLDAVTLVETPVPVSGSRPPPLSLSPDGQWICSLDYAGSTATFTERTTGVTEVYAPPGFRLNSFEWRPGGHEAWLWYPVDPQPTIWIKTPGGSATELPGYPQVLTDDLGRSSAFTRDGAYWFSSRAPVTQQPIVQVGSADDPTGPRYDLVPAGSTVYQYWQLADGRILAPAFIFTLGDERSDLYVVDPATGDTRVLGEEGVVLVVGQTRLLANLHTVDGRGDLTAIELATGRSTTLAEEYTTAAFAEPQGADPVAPGTHVAFQFTAKFASPYDGIWLATVP